mmetsp:Transcript_27842/g.46572  ORF Transcript_27842/g.46572 Transcript_27842/m.46572 type:complete len:164 (-) Transcript_27842:78-569(-)
MTRALNEMAAAAVRDATVQPAPKQADAAGGNCSPSKERGKQSKSKKHKKRRKSPSPSSSSSSSSGSSVSSGSEKMFSPGTKQKVAELVNILTNGKGKKHAKKHKKKKRSQPADPADSRGPQVYYVLQGAPSAARPLSQQEMFGGFNLPAAMRLPNSFHPYNGQ